MEEVKLNLNEKNHGAFLVLDGDEQLGEMVLAIVDNDLIVYHTEVSPKAEGKGLAKLMLNAMVAYAREKNLKVIPLCPYVHAQFKRHPADYEDIWNKIHENG
ncbi:N-acetyltransferase [Pedobacter frigiditerrae]|uniref:N-acetyltransferase n=1 Tax=Pedobacter frigiditerrae TaxID=2530452 RepID=A0A4R0N6P2_9SPHI|nr:GNAT family N-acetyltransferase [Pedobacter frigiditerrae]TCC94332.1 N-acetyltransferase [Pedobacter frigiditerrae]